MLPVKSSNGLVGMWMSWRVGVHGLLYGPQQQALLLGQSYVQALVPLALAVFHQPASTLVHRSTQSDLRPNDLSAGLRAQAQ